jgi:CRP-like cAMP-binding protein
MIRLNRYEAGEVIVRENELGEIAYVITQGKVEVTKESEGQRFTWLILEREKPSAK